MSLLKTAHLSDLGSWKNFASGTVENVYPNPIEANTIADLVLFELSEHGYNKVTVTLSNSFNSGYMGENMKYKEAEIRGIDENNFNVSRCNGQVINGSEMHTGSNSPYRFRLEKAYSSCELYSAEADTLSNLVLKLASDGIKGTITITFDPFYRNSNLEIKRLHIVL